MLIKDRTGIRVTRQTDLKPKIPFGNNAYFSLKFEKLSQFFQQ